MEYNQLQQLPKEIGTFENLKSLILNDNKLKSLPEEISQLEELELLILSNNQLKTMPDQMDNLKNLKTLILIGNPIATSEKERIKNLLPNCRVYFWTNTPIFRVPLTPHIEGASFFLNSLKMLGLKSLGKGNSFCLRVTHIHDYVI